MVPVQQRSVRPSINFIVLALLLWLISCSPLALVPPSPTPIFSTAPVPTAPLPTPAAVSPPPAGNSQRSLKVNGQNRSYVLHIPPGADTLHPVPVVFAFHGYSGNPKNMESISRFNELSDQDGFLVVFPVGEGTNANDNSWNAGISCCGVAVEHSIDDVAFVRQILSDLKSLANIDSKRIYAAGMSNGAMFSYRLGCEMSDTFAAIAPVAGVLVYTQCQPKEPVSLIHIHGMADPLVPFEGQKYSGPLTYPEFATPVLFQPVLTSITTWAQFDGCSGAPQVTREQKGVTHTHYASCRSNTQVELYALDAVGHTWASNPVFPTTQTIWDFFVAHPKP